MRFGNVAFADGRLLQDFKSRSEKGQPVAAPNDFRRYFVIPKKVGELCLITFSEIAVRYLRGLGYEPRGMLTRG